MHRKIIFAIHRTIQWLLLSLIALYRACIRPFLGNHCRFYPSCSEYAKEALMTRSVISALLLISKRLLRCHPFTQGGFDPLTCVNTECRLLSHSHTH